MPLAIEITLNIFWIPLACLLSAIAGFVLRNSQLHQLREQIRKLEKQNLQADSEILTLQKANGLLQEQIKNNPVPVIPMTTKENPETLPDTASRKKLLGKSTANP
jgi:hypothetical protein